MMKIISKLYLTGAIALKSATAVFLLAIIAFNSGPAFGKETFLQCDGQETFFWKHEVRGTSKKPYIIKMDFDVGDRESYFIIQNYELRFWNDDYKNIRSTSLKRTDIDYAGSDTIRIGSGEMRVATFRLNRISGELIYYSRTYKTVSPSSDEITFETKFIGICREAHSKF